MRICFAVTSVVLLICGLTHPAAAITINNPNYQVEVFANYGGAGVGSVGFSLAFDDQGNLYAPHTSGQIYRIASDGTPSLLASGVGTIRDMAWTGGTLYGNNLYVTDIASSYIKKIDMNGTVTNFSYISRDPVALELDRVGNYGGVFYSGENAFDLVRIVLSSGFKATFSSSFYLNSGGVEGIAFDPGSRYGGLMYAGIFSNSASSERGIYALDTEGNATKFSQNLAWAQQLEFDTGMDFDGSLFAMGTDVLGDKRKLWQVDENGTAVLFAETTEFDLAGFCFGPDGDLYVAEYVGNNVTTIHRITAVPEPASILLLSLGACFLTKRKLHR